MRDLRQPRRRFWTPEEDNELRRLSGEGGTPRRIALLLGRTRLAIETRLAVLRRRLANDEDAD
jgi:hypothetical protein